MAQYCPAITSHGVEEVLPLSHAELIELEALARFVCHDLGHQAGARFGCCDECLAFAARLFAFQKEA